MTRLILLMTLAGVVGCGSGGGKDLPTTTDPDANGRKYLKVTKTPIQDVGTDPTYAEYFVRRTAVPGGLAPQAHDRYRETLPPHGPSLPFLGFSVKPTAGRPALA